MKELSKSEFIHRKAIQRYILPTVNKWFSLINVLENCGLHMQYINTSNSILCNPLDLDNY